MYDLSKLTQQKDLLLKELNEKNRKNSIVVDKGKEIVSSGNVVSSSKNPSVNTIISSKKYSSKTLPLFVTFEFVNMNVHNWLVDSRVSSKINIISQLIGHIYSHLTMANIKKYE